MTTTQTDRLALLAEQTNDALFLAGEDGRILEANPRAAKACGRTVAELRQKTLADLCTSEERGRFEEHAGRLRREGHGLFETVHRRRDGSAFPVELSARLAETGGVSGSRS